ncbi:hypothetical protein [Rothia nasimurium]|uniref:hypothetical protein n=1 Tax=Rothia nasimurium TaxID=85336 RepID=UPI002DD6AC0E|nr:hypothetical protein [Rothia nasimurium]
MTSLDQQGLQTSRRGLMRFAAITGVAGVATAAGGAVLSSSAHATDATAPAFPADLTYPAVTGPSLALWGSSSFEGAQANQGVPAGFNATLDALLSGYLSVPVLKFGRGGETSSMIAARRGVAKNIYKLSFPHDRIPASGSVEVTLSEPSLAWGSSAYLPGYVGAVAGVLRAGGTEGSYIFTRITPGEEIYAPAQSPAAWFHSYQEMISRSSYHVLQIGRNNMNDLAQIQKDTENCYALAPEHTLVMGHFASRDDGADSERIKQARAYNAWAAETYGNRFMNPETYLRDTTQESWLRYGALSGSGVWSSDKDRKAYEAGQIPPSLYSSDGLHLNGWGYIALSQMVYYKVTELGWF